MATMHDLTRLNLGYKLSSDPFSPLSSSDEEDDFSDALGKEDELFNSDIEFTLDDYSDEEDFDYNSDQSSNLSHDSVCSEATPVVPPSSQTSSPEPPLWYIVGRVTVVELIKILWLFIKFAVLTVIIYAVSFVVIHYLDEEKLNALLRAKGYDVKVSDSDTCPAA